MKNQVEIPYRAVKRTSLDGKTWWVIWDNIHNCYSTRTDHEKSHKESCGVENQ